MLSFGTDIWAIFRYRLCCQHTMMMDKIFSEIQYFFLITDLCMQFMLISFEITSLLRFFTLLLYTKGEVYVYIFYFNQLILWNVINGIIFIFTGTLFEPILS